MSGLFRVSPYGGSQVTEGIYSYTCDAINAMKWDRIAIVGVGLIGGSIGLALRQHKLAQHVVGIGRNSTRLSRAQDLGAIDSTTTQLDRGVADAELIIVCTPVQQIPDFVNQVAAFAPRGALVTDAGSTKEAIVSAIHAPLPNEVVFIGSHPLAGSEKQGVEHARSDLFDGASCVVTPTASTPPSAIQRVSQFWQELRAKVRVMGPEAHDMALAHTSHLPHLMASALAGSLDPSYHELAASGFRDTTRIASGDVELWSGIFDQNQTALLEALARLIQELETYRELLSQSDMEGVCKMLTRAKRNRDDLGS